MLQVNLLGSFGILIDGRRLRPDLGPSGTRMAAYLFASPGRLHRRERVADLFWPQLDQDRSKAALNSALWRLRRILGQEPDSQGGRNLQSIGEDLVLDPAPWLVVDANVITSLSARIADGRPHAANVEPRAIQEAVDLYNGLLLEGEDEHPFIEERERVHTCFVRLSRILLSEYVERQSYEDAISICRRVLLFDPYREYFVRKLLALLCAAEQRAEAMRFYDRWRKMLVDEIGVEPMPDTANLIKSIRCCDGATLLNSIHQMLADDRRLSLN